jgi:hypothetical protein
MVALVLATMVVGVVGYSFYSTSGGIGETASGVKCDTSKLLYCTSGAKWNPACGAAPDCSNVVGGGGGGGGGSGGSGGGSGESPTDADVVVNVDYGNKVGTNKLTLGFQLDGPEIRTWRNSQELQDLAKEGGFKLIRFFEHRVYGGKSACNSWSNTNMRCNGWNWTETDQVMQGIYNADAEPLVVLGFASFNAGGLSTLPPGMSVDPTTRLPDPDQWAAYCVEWMDHFVDMGFNVTYYELVNEPYHYFEWDKQPRLGYYMELYNAASKAMRAKDPNIMIGSDGCIIKKVLDYFITDGEPLDFISFHGYGVGPEYDATNEKIFGAAESKYIYETNSVYGVLKAKERYRQGRGLDLPMFKTEGNVNHAWENGTDPRISNMTGAVFTALSVKTLMVNGVSYNIYFHLGSSKRTGQSKPAGGTGFGMVNTDDNKPYYPYYVQKWIANNLDVGDNIVESYSDSPNLRTVAWINGDTLNILLIHNETGEKNVYLGGLSGTLSYLKIDDPDDTTWEDPVIRTGTVQIPGMITMDGYTVMLLQKPEYWKVEEQDLSWFRDLRGFGLWAYGTLEMEQETLTQADYNQMKSWGFNTVSSSIKISRVFQPDSAEWVPEKLESIRKHVEYANNAGMKIILAPSTSEPSYADDWFKHGDLHESDKQELFYQIHESIYDDLTNQYPNVIQSVLYFPFHQQDSVSTSDRSIYEDVIVPNTIDRLRREGYYGVIGITWVHAVVDAKELTDDPNVFYAYTNYEPSSVSHQGGTYDGDTIPLRERDTAAYNFRQSTNNEVFCFEWGVKWRDSSELRDDQIQYVSNMKVIHEEYDIPNAYWSYGSVDTFGVLNTDKTPTQIVDAIKPSAAETPDEGSGEDVVMKSIQWVRYSDSPAFTSTQGQQAIEDLKQYIPHTNYIYMDVFVNSIDNTPTPRTSYVSEYGPAVQKAKELGFKVLWRVQPKTDSGLNRMNYMPSNVDSWFDDYTDAVVYWATLAEEYGVDDFMVGTELSKIEIHNNNWISLLQDVRHIYTGKVGYNTNFWYEDAQLNEKVSATWMGELDYIGVSAYWRMCTDEQAQQGVTVDQLVSNWHSYVGGTNIKGDDIVEQHLKVLSETHNRPIVIVTGMESAEDACMTPWDWSRTTVDLQEQDNWYEAVFRVFHDQPWIHGFMFDGAWETRADKRMSPNNDEFNIQGKPTEQTVEEWFATLTQPDGLKVLRFESGQGMHVCTSTDGVCIAPLIDTYSIATWASDPRYDLFDELHSTDPTTKIFVYRNFQAILDGGEDWREASDDWFLKDEYGEYIREGDHLQNVVTDPTNTEYREWLVDWLINRTDMGYEGVFADNSLEAFVPYTTASKRLTAWPLKANGDPYTDDEWREDYIDLVNYVRDRIDVPMLCNGIWNGYNFYNNRAEFEEFLSQANFDIVFMEGVFTNMKGVPWRESIWGQSVETLIWLQESWLDDPDKYLVIWSQARAGINETADRDRTAKFIFASALMGISKDGQNYVSPHGHMEPAKIQALYDIDLGVPLGDYHVIQGTNVYERDFSKVRVLVSPTMQNYTIDLGGSYETIDGNTVSGDFTIYGHTGEILLKT